MTFTYKLARRLARLRPTPALLVSILAACAAGEPTGTSSDPPTDPSLDGPVAISPRSVTLEGTQNVLFRAFESLIPGSNQVTSIEWTTTGGSINAGGDYSSGFNGAFKVIGRRKGNPHNPPDTSVVIVVPPEPTLVAVEVSPSTATVAGGLQQQFSVVGRRSDGTYVPIGVTWSTTSGAIDAGGLYTASRTAGSYKVIAKHVTTGLADTAVVTVPPATLTSITLLPTSVSLSSGQSQQFNVSGRLSDGTTTVAVPVAYTATGGSISVNGYYTAGSTSGTYRVIATAQNGKADTSAVAISGSTPSWGGLSYYANFENGVWPDGSGASANGGNTITPYSAAARPAGAPAPRSGNYAVEFHATDPTSYRPQRDLKYFSLGQEVWQAWSLWVPPSLVPPSERSTWLMFREDYGPPYIGHPAVSYTLWKTSTGAEQIVVSVGDRGPVAQVPLVKGAWIDFLAHVKYGNTESTGFLELWINGKPITFSTGSTHLVGRTMQLDATTAVFIVNLYSGPVVDRKFYFDEIRIGATRTAVEIPSP